MKKENTLVSNRRARHDYEILDTFEAGIVLQGTEVKSLREHHGSLSESYIKILHGEAWLIGCHVPHYSHGNIYNHEEVRDRKLLLHKKEIQRLKETTQEKGLTLVPLGIHLSTKGKIKVSFGLGKGKKLYDKRHSIKEKDEKRRMQRATKENM